MYEGSVCPFYLNGQKNKVLQEKYLFKNKRYLLRDFKIAISQSMPQKVSRLNFYKIDADFNIGDFTFHIKNPSREIFKINFCYGKNDLNSLWAFLEILVDAKETICHYTIKGIYETLIYIDILDKYNIRFIVAQYNCKDCSCQIKTDVVLNKKELIREFYNKLTKLFKQYDTIAYFEPPFIIKYDYWTKDSDKIKEYLGIKKKTYTSLSAR